MRKTGESRYDGCLCFSSRCLVIFSGALSIISCLSTILLSIYLIFNSEKFNQLSSNFSSWLHQHHGDKEVLDVAISYFNILKTHHEAALLGVISAAVLHLLLSLLLLLGAMLHKHLLLVPWMVTDMFLIIIIFLARDVFSTWSFLSFFVGLMAAIIFPFVAGLVLGVKILLWRQVKTYYFLQAQALKINQEYEMLKNSENSRPFRKISSISEES